MKTRRRLSPLEMPFDNYETLEFPEITLFKLKYNELVTKLKQSAPVRRCTRCVLANRLTLICPQESLGSYIVRVAHVAHVIRFMYTCMCAREIARVVEVANF